jgi:CRP-like cAMP-binding protein
MGPSNAKAAANRYNGADGHDHCDLDAPAKLVDLAMDRQQLRDLLTELQFSAALPEKVLDELAQSAQLQGCPAGTVLFREGERNHNLYLISVGGVALEMHVPGRGRVRVLSLGPGDVLAWSALLGNGEMTATAIALEDTQVISLSGHWLQGVCEAHHDVGYALMQRMCIALSQRLLATRLQLLDLFSNTALADAMEK